MQSFEHFRVPAKTSAAGKLRLTTAVPLYRVLSCMG
jgi:hypothetical protein